MNNKPPIAVIIPAAGFGTRMGTKVAKQFISVNGKTILAHTVDKFHNWAKEYQHTITIIVALSSDADLPSDVNNVITCLGGKERANSVANALETLGNIKNKPEWVMVHDAARPMININDIEKLYQSIKNDEVGGILAEKITATVKKVDNNIISKTIPRENLWLAQTPQLFRFNILKKSLQNDIEKLTDEASGIELMGLPVRIIEGNRNNIKITTPDDLDFFERYVDMYVI